MKYRVIEDLDAPDEGRFIVQMSCAGYLWAEESRHADQLSAEIAMEKLAAPPRVIASISSDGFR